MPLEQAEAIVLRTSPIGDQDKLCAFLTRDKGVLRGVAKGARKFGNRFGSSLEPMTHVQVFYYEKERRDLVTISACDLLDSFFDVQKNLRAALTTSYFAELVEEFVPVRAREDVVFRLLLAVLQALDGNGDPDFLTRYFEAWLLHVHGVLPDVKRCKKCRKPIEADGWLAPRRDGVYCGDCAPVRKEEIRRELALFLAWVRKYPPPRESVPGFGPSELKGISAALQAMIVFHLEREPRSLRFIKS
jgi:DNA repair protein RecO (recombination protein O)